MNEKLNQALGDWRQSATNVKSRIYAETIEGKKRKNKKATYLKISVAAAILATGVATTIWATNDRSPSPTSLNEVEQQNEKQESNVREISEMYLNIAQYENFYNNEQIESGYYVVWNTLYKALEYYALFDHLATSDIRWDEEDRELARNSVKSALEYDLKDPSFAAYFEKMKQDLSITEDIYIDEYLLVEREYDLLYSKMFASNVGLEDGSYESWTALDKYMQKLGITEDYTNYLYARIKEHLEPLDPQPNLLFNQQNQEEETYFTLLTTNSKGEYIFINSSFSWIDLPSSLRDYYYSFQQRLGLPEITRRTFPQYVEALEKEIADQDTLEAKKVLEYLQIAERTIEWSFTPESYQYNDIPTFDLKNLRTHKERTIDLISHELYYKNAMLYDESAAYREAVEHVISMYGLFNFLAQEYQYGWTTAIRAEHAERLKEEYEEKLANDPEEKAYFDNLLQIFNITIDDYVNDYLVLDEEYNALRAAMTAEKIGIDPDGRYSSNLQNNKYQNSIGLTWTKISEKFELLTLRDKYYEELSPQPSMPFEMNDVWGMAIAENDEGEYILAYPGYIVDSLTDVQRSAYSSIQQLYNLQPLARYNVKKYMEYAKSLDTPAATELYEILVLFDRTVNK